MIALRKIGATITAFLKEERAAATLEYTLVFTPIVFMLFFVFETALAFHWMLSRQKAAEIGVRTAIVTAPVVNELTKSSGLGVEVVTREIAVGGVAGDACFSGSCLPISTMWCSGGTRLSENTPSVTCDADRFARIFSEMEGKTYSLEAEDVTIVYSDHSLGYAGEKYVPVVTVSVAQQDYPIALGLLGTNTSIPSVSSSLVAEDLSD